MLLELACMCGAAGALAACFVSGPLRALVQSEEVLWSHPALGEFRHVDLLAAPALVFVTAFMRLLSAPHRSRSRRPSSAAAGPVPGQRLQPDWLDMELQKPRLAILFASQTGTAESYARSLGKQAKNMGFRVKVEDLMDYDTTNLASEGFAVFVVSTYGEGEPPDSSRDFYDWLHEPARNAGEDYSGLRYAVFGLGDTQYKHFCQMGKDVDARMEAIGAQRLCDLGTGDTDQNVEEDFDDWKASLWGHAGVFGVQLRDEFEIPPERTMEIKWQEPTAAPADARPYPRCTAAIPPSQKLPCWGVVKCNRELLRQSAGPERSTRHIEIDVSGTSLAQEGGYEAGDHLGVLAAQSDAAVAEYAKVLRLSPQQLNGVVVLASREGNTKRNNLPAKVPVHTALKWYFDLQGVPKKSVLRAFTHFTQDPAERKEFQDMLRVGADNVARYHAAAAKARTVAGFLALFPSTRVPLDFFMETMPRTQPRWYSIASDSAAAEQKGSIHICVALTPGGLASTFLHSTPEGESVPCFVRKSTFHLPPRDKKRPLVMIGPGTGVAPLVGFLHRRRAWKAKWYDLGECRFYFGCRAKADDWLYQELQEECQREGIITQLRCAFSRDQPQKVYVQHLLRDDGAEVWTLLQAGANIYVCGDAKHMAKDVDECLTAICESHGGMSRPAAEKLLGDKEKRGEYIKDVWTS
eukprot:TRINITY_DN212_c0_g2_i1.p1 TRINITY_DN212_c0_g2~~TRINITY_DN212_c0_g2_i1.p1  ORF type:complete len:724 (+),score=257.53 TRINITY_DN212_c0_g2_i1:98-2173(+)